MIKSGSVVEEIESDFRSSEPYDVNAGRAMSAIKTTSDNSHDVHAPFCPGSVCLRVTLWSFGISQLLTKKVIEAMQFHGKGKSSGVRPGGKQALPLAIGVTLAQLEPF